MHSSLHRHCYGHCGKMLFVEVDRSFYVDLILLLAPQEPKVSLALDKNSDTALVGAFSQQICNLIFIRGTQSIFISKTALTLIK